MRALSIRQPFAELIPSTDSGQALLGVKRIEYRSWATRLFGEPFYIYAARKPDPRQAGDPLTEARRIWSNDLAAPDWADRGAAPPPRTRRANPRRRAFPSPQ